MIDLHHFFKYKTHVINEQCFNVVLYLFTSSSYLVIRIFLNICENLITELHPILSVMTDIQSNKKEVLMKNLISIVIVSVFLFVSSLANAGQFGDLHAKVVEARDALITMVKNTDKRGPDQQKLVKDSADAVSAMIATMSAPAGKEAQFKEMSDNWAAFKKTREEELVPLILAGKQAEGKKIAMGVQKERLTKVLTLTKELDL